MILMSSLQSSPHWHCALTCKTKRWTPRCNTKPGIQLCVIEIFQGEVMIASFSQLSPLFPKDILLTLLSFANGSVGESCAQQLCTSPLAVNLNQQVCTCHGSKCAVCLSLGKSIRKYHMVEAFFLKVHAW